MGLTVFYFALAWLLNILLAMLTQQISFRDLPVSFKWFQPIRYGVGLPFTSGVLTIIIKLFKNMHLEQKENEFLQQQKINTELQLIKAHFQPTFLHDALQHIFYLVNKHSFQSPETILKLSDLLSYVLYDNEKDQVPLEKELQIIKTYLSLKKIFYPTNLHVHLKQEGKLTGLGIAPLLLLSLVENCFEEFLCKPTQRLTLNMDIRSENDELCVLISCKSNLKNVSENNYENYDWLKSLKRIKILYPGKHFFDAYFKSGMTNLVLILWLNENLNMPKKEEFVFL